MNTVIGEFVRNADAGQPVYVPDVRDAFGRLPGDQSFVLEMRLARTDGGTATRRLHLPRFAGLGDAERRFAVEFFLAEVNNIVSCLGGRELSLSAMDGEGKEDVAVLAEEFARAFGVNEPRHRRKGYGRSLNVAERINQALFPNLSENECRFTLFAAPPDVPSTPPPARKKRTAADAFRRAAAGLGGKAMLGMDIGGTDIKIVLTMGDDLAFLKEFDWFPTRFTDINELIRPLVVLVRLMGLAAATVSGPESSIQLEELIGPALHDSADVETMEKAIRDVEAELGDPGFLFDAIGVCFPDVVVGDKIVGGESPKTRGIREASGEAYDRHFARLTALDDRLRRFVRPGGAIAIANDGSMSAFTAGVEAAAVDAASVARGVFAHSLGTDFGAGWVTETGDIPNIPLEIYNFIIDLGSRPERAHHPDDVRSLNNFNTGLPGTMQKYAGQSGVFRLAFKYFPTARPDLLEEIRAAGYVVERNGPDGSIGLYIPNDPKDMRKPFLEYMMALVERENDPMVNHVFEEVGVSLAMVGREVDWILDPAVRRRMLFGRLVKTPACFALIEKGARGAWPETELAVADDTIAATPLMQELGRDPDYTIAQFAQAVGAVHFANSRLG